MKKIQIAFTLMTALLLPCSAPALAESSFQASCERKEKHLERRLEEARRHNNRGQMRGLEEALANVRKWCTDDGLLAKAEFTVLDKADEVAERGEDLAEARREGKPDKIAKREKKLREVQSELREAEMKRDAIRREQGQAH